MPKRNKKSNLEHISLYLASGCVFGIFIGLMAGSLVVKLTSWWINNNVPWENQDVGDAAAIFAVAIIIFQLCVILGIFGGFISYIRDNKKK